MIRAKAGEVYGVGLSISITCMNATCSNTNSLAISEVNVVPLPLAWIDIDSPRTGHSSASFVYNRKICDYAEHFED